MLALSLPVCKPPEAVSWTPRLLAAFMRQAQAIRNVGIDQNESRSFTKFITG